MEKQPNPVPNVYRTIISEVGQMLQREEDPVAALVLQDAIERAEYGKLQYGTYLQPFNGRDAKMDAYEEALDLLFYLRQWYDETHDSLASQMIFSIIGACLMLKKSMLDQQEKE